MTDWNEEDFPDDPFDYHDEIPEVLSLQGQPVSGSVDCPASGAWNNSSPGDAPRQMDAHPQGAPI